MKVGKKSEGNESKMEKSMKVLGVILILILLVVGSVFSSVVLAGGVSNNLTRSIVNKGLIDQDAMNFGNGTTGIGGIVKHTYSSAADYMVNFTVPNDDGVNIPTLEKVKVSQEGVPLLDATHAVHPFNVDDYQGFYPDLKVLTLNYTVIYLNKTHHNVDGAVEVDFDLDEDIAVLGFKVTYVGSWGRFGVNIESPDGTKEEVFDDTISNGKSWQFHYHNASAGNWTLNLVTTQLANITLIVGECEEPFKISDLNEKDFVILCSPYQNYTTKEREIIHEYVSTGGSLLISGESGDRIWGRNLNQLIKPFGIELNDGLHDPTNNSGKDFQPILHNFTNHSIALRAKELGVNEIQVAAGGALKFSNSDAKVVLRGDSDTTALPTYPEGTYPPFAATSIYGEGKIFVQGDSSSGPKEWYQAISEWYQRKHPVANFTYSPKSPIVGQTITFNASPSYNPDGNITAYNWSFGDGNTGTGEVTTHFYSSARDYTVNLTVTDNDGAVNNTDKTITVYPYTSVFDTKASKNPYPSIMGTYRGEIKPSHNINVSKLYTYPCVGTGGHTESIKLEENGIPLANGTWNGYQGGWHNITLRNVSGAPYVMLYEGHEYNYTIVTGSYPQIIHEPLKEVTGGTITCTLFTDANGKTYTDWIPAIRLE